MRFKGLVTKPLIFAMGHSFYNAFNRGDSQPYRLYLASFERSKEMMTNYEVLYEAVKFGVTACASKGAKILMDEAVKQFTPENLDNTKKMCVEIAKWGGATAFGAVCAKSVSDKLEKGKAYVDAAAKLINVIKDENAKKSEPVVKDVEENKIVEIDDPELVEEETEEDFLK